MSFYVIFVEAIVSISCGAINQPAGAKVKYANFQDFVFPVIYQSEGKAVVECVAPVGNIDV